MNVIRKIMILCLLAGMLMPVWAKITDDYVRDQVGWDDHEYPFHTKGDRLYFRERGWTSGVYCPDVI